MVDTAAEPNTAQRVKPVVFTLKTFRELVASQLEPTDIVAGVFRYPGVSLIGSEAKAGTYSEPTP